MDDVFRFPLTVRYAEVDQQAVVFNAHYLTWFDEAFTAFADAHGVPFAPDDKDGIDVHLRHSELEWERPVRWRDDVAVLVSPSQLGTKSFSLDFIVEANGSPAARGRTVYVVIGPDGARPVPDKLRAALEPLRPLY